MKFPLLSCSIVDITRPSKTGVQVTKALPVDFSIKKDLVLHNHRIDALTHVYIWQQSSGDLLRTGVWSLKAGEKSWNKYIDNP